MNDRILITGGAGFIGTNLANYYLSAQRQVTIFDNFSRPGSEENARWLKQRHGARLRIVRGDIRALDGEFQALVEDADVLFHLAGQVAVTTSVVQPVEDFEINAHGTLNVLEAVRRSMSRPVLLYSSTNKVYGKMQDVAIVERHGRYVYDGLDAGVPVTWPLDFYSPYGCSKGCGDQYVRDYARIYGLRTVVFRQSCIYGPHQFGLEDQGWVAWFAIRAMQGLPFTIYGDGKQVRDVLHVDDLVAAYDAAVTRIETTRGRAYNIGGGPRNMLSLLDLITLLEKKFGGAVEYGFDTWRPGDQRVFVSDVREATHDFGWTPRISVADGVDGLLEWLEANRALFPAAARGGDETMAKDLRRCGGRQGLAR